MDQTEAVVVPVSCPDSLLALNGGQTRTDHMTVLTNFFFATLRVVADVVDARDLVGAGDALEPIGTRERTAENICSERTRKGGEGDVLYYRTLHQAATMQVECEGAMAFN